ncbi:hypothetical protein [Azospirillum palustre]
MATGLLAHLNELSEQDCAITGQAGDWAATAPLDALKTLPLVDAAVSTRIGSRDEPVVLEWEWDRPVDLTYAGLYRTNLWKTGRIRLEAFKTSARTSLAFTTQHASGIDRLVLPGLYDPKTLRFGGENTVLGQLGAREFLRYPTNIHVTMPLCSAQVLRWTVYGPAYRVTGSRYSTTEQAYRIGFGWAGDSLAFDRHVGASAEGYRRGGKVTGLAGGGVAVEPGRGRRTATLDRTVNEAGDRDRLFDLVNFLDADRPAVWLPDTDSAFDCYRYGGLFQVIEDFSQKYLNDLHSAATISLGEVTT